MATGKVSKLDFTTTTGTVYSGDGLNPGQSDMRTFYPPAIPSGYKLHSLRSFVSEIGSFIAVPTAMSDTSATVRFLNCGNTATNPGIMTAVFNVVPK